LHLATVIFSYQQQINYLLDYFLYVLLVRQSL